MTLMGRIATSGKPMGRPDSTGRLNACCGAALPRLACATQTSQAWSGSAESCACRWLKRMRERRRLTEQQGQGEQPGKQAARQHGRILLLRGSTGGTGS